MRTISKGNEPASLLAHRKTKHSNYHNYSEKDELRNALVTEQHGLCCYCMGRIRPDQGSMKIEHWRSLSHYPKEQLNYQNLLGACLGGDGKPARKQHCDTRKRDSNLKWNPAQPTHHIETRIRYESDGSIRSDEAVFDRQLNKVLNLNLAILKNNRKSLLDAVLEWWKHEKALFNGPVPRSRIDQKRNKYLNGSGDLLPYCQVVVWWLDKRLARMTPADSGQ